jgi:uracil-DNA glycosylase
VAMYHPAAALHQPSLKSTVEKDFMRLPEYIQLVKIAQPARNAPPSESMDINEPKAPAADDEPTQLSLF